MNDIKVEYKGFEIEAEREKSLGGWGSIYYTVMHKEGGWFLKDSFYDGEDKIKGFIDCLKRNVDDYYENPEFYEG